MAGWRVESFISMSLQIILEFAIASYWVNPFSPRPKTVFFLFRITSTWHKMRFNRIVKVWNMIAHHRAVIQLTSVNFWGLWWNWQKSNRVTKLSDFIGVKSFLTNCKLFLRACCTSTLSYPLVHWSVWRLAERGRCGWWGGRGQECSQCR